MMRIRNPFKSYDLVEKKDIALIFEQCKLQNATSLFELNAFTDAYRHAKELAYARKTNDLTAGELLSIVKELAAITDPRVNDLGYRFVPAIIYSGKRQPIDWRFIVRAMDAWAEAVVNKRLSPTEAYREFEHIHPFIDGNGRVGHLVWAILHMRDFGKWPMMLPPDLFGES